jgi:hypothetical protein
MSEIDMKLDDDQASDFNSETPMTNIWALHDEDEDKHEDDKKDKGHDKKSSQDDEDEEHEVVTSNLEDDLEKPSFLRRLSRRGKSQDSEDKESDGDS